jgi:hypothetical protein
MTCKILDFAVLFKSPISFKKFVIRKLMSTKLSRKSVQYIKSLIHIQTIRGSILEAEYMFQV